MDAHVQAIPNSLQLEARADGAWRRSGRRRPETPWMAERAGVAFEQGWMPCEI
jgi:hypothetical protein